MAGKNKEYADKYAEYAMEQMRRYGIPASVTLAQGILESSNGQSELARKEKEAKKKQKTIEIKEVRLSPNIDTNDLNTKVGAARKFITKGDKVKVTLRFRGREMAHSALGADVLKRFAEALPQASMDKPPVLEGRTMSILLIPKPNKD